MCVKPYGWALLGVSLLFTFSRTRAKDPPEETAEIQRFLGHESSVRCVAFFPEGKTIASGSGNWITPAASGKGTPNDLTLRMWDLASGKELRRYKGYEGPIHCLAISADSKWMLSGSGQNSSSPVGKGLDTAVRVWNEATGRMKYRWEHKSAIESLALAPGGRHVLMGSSGEQAFWIWDLETGKELRRVPLADKNQIHGMAFSPDARQVVTVGHEISLWEVETGKKLRGFEGTYKDHKGIVWSAAFSPDGKKLATGSGFFASRLKRTAYVDCIVRIWDVSTGKEIHKLEGHEDYLTCVAFSSDGRRLLSGSGNSIFTRNEVNKPLTSDYSVRLWDVGTGKELACLKGHTAAVRAVAFSPDGRFALSGSDDQSIRLWRLPK